MTNIELKPVVREDVEIVWRMQEKGNLYLYEKLGYHRTGRVDKINERMDIVFYEKD